MSYGLSITSFKDMILSCQEAKFNKFSCNLGILGLVLINPLIVFFIKIINRENSKADENYINKLENKVERLEKKFKEK